MGNIVLWAKELLSTQQTGPLKLASGQSSATLASLSKREQGEIINGMFGALYGYYGKMLTDRYGENLGPIKGIWAAELSDLTAEQIKAGMEWVRDNCKFLPTLPEFRQACKGAKVAALKIPGWWESEGLTLKQGDLLGISPRIGESWGEFRARIKALLQAVEEL